MNLREVFEKRKSIRKFTGEPIKEEQIKLIMEAAQIAPSASNKQPYKFIVIKNDEFKKVLRKKAVPQRFIEKAAVIFVALGNKKEAEYFYKVDIGIVVQHMALQAAELGLGSCWMGAIKRDELRELLKVPNDWEIVILLAVGIPDQDPPARARKSLDKLFVNDSFQ